MPPSPSHFLKEPHLTASKTKDAPEGLREDSGVPVGTSAATPTPKPSSTLSESLSAAVDASAPLHILGQDDFELALSEIFMRPGSRREARSSGIIALTSREHPFLFKTPKDRASYVFKNVFGLVWPCHASQQEKRRLMQSFHEGWESGDLEFLAEVPFPEIDQYREHLTCTG